MDKRPGTDYDPLASMLSAMGAKIQVLVEDLIHAIGVIPLDVRHRVKKSDSASKKIQSSEGKYVTYNDLHDLLGVRVITYLASDVDKVVEALRAEFTVDEDRSLDKMEQMDPDRFGYLSYHLVVKLDVHREDLREWAPYKDVYFEVQIRSVLQHAWAEIEHDLGYKSKTGIPAHLVRRFARLAGLLETADSEFDAISTEAAAHAERVRDVIESGGDAAIDRDSIGALIASDDIVRRADLLIAQRLGIHLDLDSSRSGYADARADELRAVGFISTEDVVQSIKNELDQLVEFASTWLGRPRRVEDPFDEPGPDQDGDGRYLYLPLGVCLYYLYLHRTLIAPDGWSRLEVIGWLREPETQREFRQAHEMAYGI